MDFNPAARMSLNYTGGGISTDAEMPTPVKKIVSRSFSDHFTANCSESIKCSSNRYKPLMKAAEDWKKDQLKDFKADGGDCFVRDQFYASKEVFPSIEAIKSTYTSRGFLDVAFVVYGMVMMTMAVWCCFPVTRGQDFGDWRFEPIEAAPIEAPPIEAPPIGAPPIDRSESDL